MKGRTRPVVAIDGPAGAGKSTVTQRVASALGYQRVDTGAIYRAVAFLCVERGIPWDQEQAVSEVALELARTGSLQLSTSGDDVAVRVHGRDVSHEIRSREASTGASQVSQLPSVRSALLVLQRELGKDGGVVLEGRDIGSVVFPDAEAKFFLTASASVRAERRLAEMAERGDKLPLETMIREVNERDRRDTERPIAPLLQAPDAIVVDSSDMDIDEVVEIMVAHVRTREQLMG